MDWHGDNRLRDSYKAMITAGFKLGGQHIARLELRAEEF